MGEWEWRQVEWVEGVGRGWDLLWMLFGVDEENWWCLGSIESVLGSILLVFDSFFASLDPYFAPFGALSTMEHPYELSEAKSKFWIFTIRPLPRAYFG